ncbi:hypothetical protein [Chamaesiphon sp.]|uniref:hypothetical protein n=1 Tax=Chamaesiphon sp. TaxID=2814140 RepID=UPI0035945148
MKETKMEVQSIIGQVVSPASQNRSGEVVPSLVNAVFINIALVAVCFALFIPIYAYISKQRQHKFKIGQHHKVACHRCRYFSNNLYVQCALHPTSVMTEQAIDCKDYTAKAQAK